MADQGLLTSLQPQGTEDYDLEKQQEEWSILEVGGCVAEVLTAIAFCHICSCCLTSRPLLQESTVSVDQHLAVTLANLLQTVLVRSTSKTAVKLLELCYDSMSFI